jgi:hypothetical protein
VNQNIIFLCKKKGKSLPGRHARVPDASQLFDSVRARKLAHTALGAVTPLRLARNPTGPTHDALTHARRLQPSRWIVATRKRQSRIRAVTPTPSRNGATRPPPTRPRRSPTRQTRRRGRGEGRRRRACNVIVSAGCRSARY